MAKKYRIHKNGKRLKKDILDSRENIKFFKQEKNGEAGLRNPQVGAIYAMLSHRTISNKPGTVIMPTGTGKTEAMIGVCLISKPKCLLVIVPSRLLRGQLFNKFCNLGILKSEKIIEENVLTPIVTELHGGINNLDEAKEIIETSNVIVSVAKSITQCSNDVLGYFAENISHVFIDEAHHEPADTRKIIKNNFMKKSKILQFTATPYRNDQQKIEGDFIYEYPLSLAQKDGYFVKIDYKPCFGDDLTLAQAAVDQLKNDIDSGYNHMLLVRASTIKKAEKLKSIYEKIGSEFNPCILHSQFSNKNRNKVLKEISDGQTKIIIGVNMFGEGIDFPNLKIVALHDIYKNIGSTIQFVGRITRSNAEKIGKATVLVNLLDVKLNKALNSLFSKDANWNLILSIESNNLITKEKTNRQMISEFEGQDKDIINYINPKKSLIIYELKSEIDFDAFFKKFDNSYYQWQNKEKGIGIIITHRRERHTRSQYSELNDSVFDLSVFYHKENKLFIGSTNIEIINSILKKSKIDYEPVDGEKIFRVFAGVKRIILHTIGLKPAIYGSLRFKMYAGIDIKEALTQTELKNSVKSNIFGMGYENSQKITLGASMKGKIWAREIVSLHERIKRCEEVDKKVFNESLNAKEELLKGVLIPDEIDKFPTENVVTIERPIYFLYDDNADDLVKIGQNDVSIYDLDLIFEEKTEKSLLFKIESDLGISKYSCNFKDGKVVYSKTEGDDIFITIKGVEVKIEDFLAREGLIIRYTNSGYSENKYYIKPYSDSQFIFNEDNFIVKDRTGIDIQKELGNVGDKDSIHYFVSESLKDREILIYDHGKGEIADFISISSDDRDKKIFIELYHCKGSDKVNPGSRLSDLYEVCGQAQKSVSRRENMERLFNRVWNKTKEKQERLLGGNLEKLHELKAKFEYGYEITFEVFIVQPGISKNKVMSTPDELNILAATEDYLKNTYGISLQVFCSD